MNGKTNMALKRKKKKFKKLLEFLLENFGNQNIIGEKLYIIIFCGNNSAKCIRLLIT